MSVLSFFWGVQSGIGIIGLALNLIVLVVFYKARHSLWTSINTVIGYIIIMNNERDLQLYLRLDTMYRLLYCVGTLWRGYIMTCDNPHQCSPYLAKDIVSKDSIL